VSKVTDEREDKLAWRRAFFIAVAGYPVLIGLMVYFATLPKVIAFLVEHDSVTGTYTPLGPAKPMAAPDTDSRRATIGHWLEDVYTVTDEHSQVNVRRRVFGMTKNGTDGYGSVDTLLKDPVSGTDAMRKARLIYAVTVDNVAASDNQHFTADYTLRVYDDNNTLRQASHWHAVIVAEWHPEIDDPAIIWVNPSRLFITSFITNPAGAAEPGVGGLR
jgi:type IV secretory pathway TrbF-like protein